MAEIEVTDEKLRDMQSWFSGGFEPDSEGICEYCLDKADCDELVAALRELQRRHRLIILSNTDDDLFAATAHRLGIGLGQPFDRPDSDGRDRIAMHFGDAGDEGVDLVEPGLEQRGRFGRILESLAPLIAAQRARVKIELDVLDAAQEALSRHRDVLFVEGAGGLLVPISREMTFLDPALRRARSPSASAVLNTSASGRCAHSTSCCPPSIS